MEYTNYCKFNGSVLNDIYIVTNIKRVLVPQRESSVLDIPSRNGLIFDGSKFKEMVYEVTLLVRGETQVERDMLLKDLRDILLVTEPQEFSINPNNFGFGLPVNAPEVEEKSGVDYMVTIEFQVFEPYFYAYDFKTFESETGVLTISNDGGEPVLPFVSIGFTKDAYFVQMENTETGERILIGDYPKLTLPTQATSVRVLRDPCETTSNWVLSSAPIDSNRSGGGTIAVTESGQGVCIGTLPTSTTTTWNGVCVRQNIGSELDEFTISCNMSHNSSGTNGDPSKPTTSDTETVVTGVKTYTYKVTAASLNLRTGPGTNYSKKGTVGKNYEIFGGVVNKGWIKFEYPKVGSGTYVYVSEKYTKRIAHDSTKTATTQNYTCFQATNIRSKPSVDSTNLISLPLGAVVRCNATEYKNVGKDLKTRYYYKMVKPYNGKQGYVCKGNVAPSSSVDISYPADSDYVTADDKTGMIELYGFDVNGVKLFKLGMYDDNDWYEYTYPQCSIGSKVVLQDTTKIPSPISKQVVDTSTDGKYSVKVTNYLSGRLGNWNEFWGTWTITRKKVKGQYQWDVEVKKIEDGIITKRQTSLGLKDTNFPTEKLSYVVLYMGTSKTLDKASGVALTHIQIDEINPQPESATIIQHFKGGDILDVDFQNRTAYLNGNACNNLVDIGSTFFSTNTGETNIKFISDDTNIIVGATINEKWIGCD